MVAEVEEARRRDVDGGAERDEGEDQDVCRRRGGLVADGDDGGVGAAFGVGVEGAVGGGLCGVVPAVEREGEGEAAFAFDGGVGGVDGVGARREEGDGDGEFGAEEEEEVEETGPGDWRGEWSAAELFLAGDHRGTYRKHDHWGSS